MVFAPPPAAHCRGPPPRRRLSLQPPALNVPPPFAALRNVTSLAPLMSLPRGRC